MKPFSYFLTYALLYLLSACVTTAYPEEEYLVPETAVHQLPQPQNISAELSERLNKLDSIHLFAEANPYTRFSTSTMDFIHELGDILAGEENTVLAVHRARLQRMQAWQLQNMGQNAESIPVLEASVTALENSQVQRDLAFQYEQSYHYNLQGIAKQNIFDFLGAKAAYEKSLKINLDAGLYVEAFKDHASLSQIYEVARRYAEAVDQVEKANKLHEYFEALFETNNDLLSIYALWFTGGKLKSVLAEQKFFASQEQQGVKLLRESQRLLRQAYEEVNTLNTLDAGFYKYRIDLITLANGFMHQFTNEAELANLDKAANRLLTDYDFLSEDYQQLFNASYLLYEGIYKHTFSNDQLDSLYREMLSYFATIEGSRATELAAINQVEAMRLLAMFELERYRTQGDPTALDRAEALSRRSIDRKGELLLQIKSNRSMEYASGNQFRVFSTAIKIHQEQLKINPNERESKEKILLLSDQSKSYLLVDKLQKKRQRLLKDNSIFRGSLEKVQRDLLDDNSAFLDLLISEHQIYVSLITKTDFQQWKVATTNEIINNLIVLRDGLTSANFDHRVAAYALYADLLAVPFNWLDQQGEIDQLIVSSDQAFFNIDLEALPVRRPDKKLRWSQETLMIDKYAMVEVYSLSAALLLKELARLRKPPERKWGVFAATASLSHPNGPDYPPLPSFDAFIERELSSRPGLKSLEANLDTEGEEFLAALPHYRYVAILGHGDRDEFYRDDYFLQFKPDERYKDGRVGADPISQTAIKADLIMLMNCETGSGSAYTFEGKKSLAREFIRSGALAVIGGEREVDVNTIDQVMTHFTGYWLDEGMPASRAFQRAKQRFRAQDERIPVENWARLKYLGLPNVFYAAE